MDNISLTRDEYGYFHWELPRVGDVVAHTPEEVGLMLDHYFLCHEQTHGALNLACPLCRRHNETLVNDRRVEVVKDEPWPSRIS